MPALTFINADGSEIEVNVSAGVSVMRAAVDNSVHAIIAECGGACSCATCHCYIDDKWLDKVAAPDEMEEAMLDCVLNRQENSRLSCQVEMTDELDGLIVRLPASQY